MTAKTVIGEVISNKQAKTVTVRVVVPKIAPLYGKSLRYHRNFLAHLPPTMSVKVGDTVEITFCRPLSACKHSVVTKVRGVAKTSGGKAL